MTTTRTLLLLPALAALALAPWGDGRAQEAPVPDGAADDGAAADDPADDADSEWPREIDADTATIVVYQPQIDGYEGGVISAHSAVAITADDATEPVFGAVWFRAKMEVDREARMCDILDVEVPRARFPDSTPEAEQKLAAIVRQVAPKWVHPISMDRLLPALEALERAAANDDRLRADPPRIVVETVPALLVPIDGDAKLGAVAGSRVQRVVNTPVALLFEPTTKTYWIDAGAAWVASTNVDGPYRSAMAVPPEIAAVRTSNREDGAPTAQPAESPAAAPKIVVAHAPTELIVFDGEPQWVPIVADVLLHAGNTSSAVFWARQENRFYVVLSGRWYRTASMREGPWEFVAADALPDFFREIPEDSAMGGVLAHVAGTELANEALLDAQIPQTKAIRRDAATCSVAWDGEPEFEPVAGTELSYAVNTQSQVLVCDRRYWCCDQGVWFVSESPNGPWVLADEVPREFRQIPPECPCYNVKYVYVYDSTPEVVYVGYTPGYLGWYGWDGAVVWGTGWYYPYWHHDIWYPRCSTWGVSVGYNAWSGGWYAGLSYYSRGGWSIGLGYVDRWGWGGPWWGPCGYRHWHHDDSECHRPVAWGHGFDRGPGGGVYRRDGNLYDAPRNRVRNAPGRADQRPVSRWPVGQRPTPPAGRTPPAPKAPAPQTPPVRAARPRNDVFSDGDGSVYRRRADGSWNQRSGRDWKPVESRPAPAPRPRATAPQRPQRPQVQRPPARPAPTPRLSRDAWARDRGSFRVPSGGRSAGGGRSGGGRSGGGGRHR